MAIKFLNTVQVDTDVLYVNATNDRVGIRTSNPNAALQIGDPTGSGINTNNQIHVLSALTSAGLTTSGLILATSATGIATLGMGRTQFVNENTAGKIIYSSTVDTFSFETNFSTKMVIDSSGDVGIGTTNPTAKIHIEQAIANAAIAYPLKVDVMPPGSNASSDGTGISFGIGNNGLNRKEQARITVRQNFFGVRPSMSFDTLEYNSPYTAFISRMFIDEQGNVGIGTTSPNRLLTVETTGNACYLALNSSSNNTTIGSDVNGSFVVYDDSSSTYRMVIDQTTGDVGIGTTSPGAKLDVAGNIIVSGGVSNENDGARVTNPGGASFITQTSSVAGAIKITLPQAGINTMMRMEVKVYEYTTNESFTVQCGGYSASTSQWYNEYAYIESSAKDDRNFTVRFGFDGSKSCIYIGELSSTWSYPQVFVTEFQGGYLNTTGYKDSWDISFEASAFQGVVKTQADTQINNWARSGADTYYASSTGNVGIGATSPSRKLEVRASNEGSSGGIVLTDFTNGTSMVARLQDSSTGGRLYLKTNTDSDGVVLNAGGDSYFNNGNVGIGTAIPSELLHLSSTGPARILIEADTDNATETDNAQIILKQDGGFVVGRLGYQTNSNNIEVWNEYADSVIFGTNNAERIRINAAGAVGIGVTSPGFKLDVDGEIHSSTFVSATGGLGVDSTSMGSGRGISLYNGPSYYPQYGMLFALTSDLGTFGSVSGDFATYMTMSGDGNGRGWIWKAGTVNSTSNNVASISTSGQLTLNSTATATNFIVSSDKTLKNNIKEINTKHLDVNWKSFELKSEPGIKRVGVIAQELEIKHPEFVRTAEDGLKSVAYIDLLITKIAELEARLEKAGI